MNKRMRRMMWALCPVAAFAGCAQTKPADAPQWFKGNTHAHSWWSDGDSPPEIVAAWYKDHGYHFLVISDHNTLQHGEKWVAPRRATPDAEQNYERTFGSPWVVKRQRDGKTEYRLKTADELRSRFDEPGRFLLIEGDEISDQADKKPVHLNGVNLVEAVPPQHGRTVSDALRNNIDAVLAQRKRTGQPMLTHINHPNFGWALTADDIAPIAHATFVEVYNGHPGVNTYGDAKRVGTERMWDIILTKRLGELRLPVVYGVATDDAHCFTAWATEKANPGRGWVMVRAPRLSPNDIVLAMERGDFYSSTGVVLDRIRFENNTLDIDIRPRPGVSYTTQFIGTLSGYDPKAPADAPCSPDIGRVLAEQTGPHASYRLTGREIYVRAKVVSTATHPNPSVKDDVEAAWVQPVRPQASGRPR